jgi:uncharacterized protein with von Willebrand factor type A (vWA) domain
VPVHGDVQTPDYVLHNLMMFAEVLRRLGLDVGSGNVLDLVRATEHAPIGRKQDFHQAARCILVHRKQDLALFDEAFRVFWRRPATGQVTRDLRSLGEERRYRQPQVGPPPGEDTGGEDDADGEGDDRPTDRVDLTRTFSAREVLREKDFAGFTPAEVADARRMMAGLCWNLGRRRTRRLVPGPGLELDLRKTLRRNLKYGGELMELAQRRRKDKPRPLVLICDVSGSMERYTRMLLHFIHTVAGSMDRVEAFLFATRLTRITRYLNHRGVDRAVNEVARAVPDWAGGTRIGQALKTFNFQWLRRVLGGGAVVLIISDGWDRGEPELLAREASRLQRSCHRLIWLNPLLGSASYQPSTRGMQAALPYLDDFLPVHNLNSLEALARHLNDLSPHRSLGPRFRPAPAAQPQTGATPPASQDPDPALAPTFRHPLWGRNQPRQGPGAG